MAITDNKNSWISLILKITKIFILYLLSSFLLSVVIFTVISLFGGV